MAADDNRHFFPLTTLQIGDLQSYLSRLSLFCAPESNKFFILVDNRPWLIDRDSRSAHLWQFMVTKSRLSPFANTRGRKREKKDFGRRLDLKSRSRSNSSKPKEFRRWFSVIDAALYQKKALLPVKKLKDTLLLNSELHRTLYGFIVFEASWTDVRGINYLNELQTDTSMAVEAKFMKRWEFDSIEQASRCTSSWFSGTYYEQLLLLEYLDEISVIGEVFHDAQENPSVLDPASDGESACNGGGSPEDKSPNGAVRNFSSGPTGMEYRTSLLHTPPPPSGPYKRRKIMKCLSEGVEIDAVSKEEHAEIFSSPRHSETSLSTHSIDRENAATVCDSTCYRDVLILFRFDDRDLPFKLKQIIMSDLRLLTLLESGLPSWVIFLQSYPVFCHFYRPWMCPLARALYVMISVVTVLIGFYDLYKNVPVLKATASRLCGPLFDWIETWEMISRIKYLGTMLFLHNFEKAVKWLLMTTRAVRSLFSVLTEPIAGPLAELVGFLLPFWQISLQTGETFGSVICIVIGSTCSMVENLVQMLLWPMWFIHSLIWSVAMFIIYPIIWAIWEVLTTPVYLVLASANLTVSLFSYVFYLLRDTCLLLSSMFQLASSSEPIVGTYEVSMWRALWNDLFSQVFRAIRSILNGFIAFFTACNRHRLSIYNHMQELFLRIYCLAYPSRSVDSSNARRKHGSQNPLEGGTSFKASPHWQKQLKVIKRGNQHKEVKS
ncbi:uncharacterized protein LOC131219607 [Magnolia sinica]|uniref:uncharacterized protein LOC131219607 n=1 Tax=Magnolia sinica TaxID=86752 RepID=UPI002658E88E|nr:uncharacterized protein LOC131219607 [Magnolia sinica]